MKKAGFENVDAPWQSLEWDWLKDPASYDDGKVPNRWAPPKRRTKCDGCSLDEDEAKCIRVEGTNRCQLCVNKGLPCSWTKSVVLAGTTWRSVMSSTRTQANLEARKNSPTFVRMFSAIVALRSNEEGCKAYECSDPGFRSVEDAGDVEDAK